MTNCPRQLTAFFLIALAFSLPSAVSAQPSYGDPLGEMWLSFDANQLQTQIELTAGEHFEWFVLLNVSFPDPNRDLIDGVKAWEALVEVHAQVNILERELFRNALTCNDGICGDDWQVVLDGCILGSETQAQVLRYRGQLLNDVEDVEIRLMPGNFSNFGGTAPGWATCQTSGDVTEDLHPFASRWSQSIVINSSVATRSKSWGGIKALY